MALASRTMAMFDVEGPIGRSMQKMATSPWFRKVGPKIVPPTDRLLHRLTGGRVIVSRLLVPSIVLTTVGAKSGLERETPLACVPQPVGWWVVGSNFGQEKHPAWTGNLIANPQAKVSYGATTYQVVASLLTDEQKAAVWPTLVEAWPAYDDYVESSGRNIRVFDLQPL
ncbi:MAG: nitroreductase family deazaflavin-dependent oxidoreductase [Acidimicrobiales bacterium]|nr:nitroreductase family deazaflavin-dependent oxidoreductase [Acidimicrobiales bacterium]